MERSDKRPLDPSKTAVLILAFAVSLWAFAGIARASETEKSTKADAGTEVSGEAVNPEAQQEQSAASDPAQEVQALTDPREWLSYALGMVLGNQFRDQSIEVDPDVYLRGLKDGLSGGKTLLTEAEARSAVNAVQRELRRRKAALQAPGAAAGIAVSFKLDPRLTRGLYMGDRWVSPPTYTSTVREGSEVTVDARAEGRDAKGRTSEISPRWIPADPEMVTVVPAKGKDVKITVKRAGETKVTVAAAGVSRELAIKAIRKDDTIRVEITQ